MASNVLCIRRGQSETQKCVITRSAEGEMVHVVSSRTGKGSLGKAAVGLAFAAAIWVTVLAGVGTAALPAPNWMPGSPILAGNQVILLWAPVPGAVKYNVYMSGKKVQESVSIQAIVAAPEEAGSFEFQVAGVDGTGAEGAKSSPGTVKIFKLVPPKGMEGRLVGKNVSMHWEPVGGAVLYNVYRSMESGKGFELVDSIQDVRWTDTKTQEGKKYFYRVTAKDASGKESAPSPEYMVNTEVAVAVAGGGVANVVGKKTKLLASLTTKDFGAGGIVNLDEPYDVEASPDGSRYYISSVNTHSVLIMDGKGNYLKTFGDGDSAKDGNFASPYGIGVAKDGKVYVVDANKNNVQVFSADGAFEKVFARVEKAVWMTEDPQLADVDVDDGGNVYVLEYRNGAVIKFNPSGKEIAHFVKKGADPENSAWFTTIMKVIGDKIFIADGARGRVLVCDQSGKILQKIGKKGVGVGMLQAMGGFDLGDDGLVYIVDRALALVQVYDLKEAKYQYTMANENNDGPMGLVGPKAISVDSKKNLIVVAQGMVQQVRLFEVLPEKAAEAKK